MEDRKSQCLQRLVDICRGTGNVALVTEGTIRRAMLSGYVIAKYIVAVAGQPGRGSTAIVVHAGPLRYGTKSIAMAGRPGARGNTDRLPASCEVDHRCSASKNVAVVICGSRRAWLEQAQGERIGAGVGLGARVEDIYSPYDIGGIAAVRSALQWLALLLTPWVLLLLSVWNSIVARS